MRHPLHSFLIGTLALLCGHAMAQPYQVLIHGHVMGCTPAITNGEVHVQSAPGIQPPIDIMVPLNPNCYYNTIVMVNDTAGWFQVSVSCANGSTANNSGWYVFDNVPNTATIVLDLNCTGVPIDCNGVPNGPAMPGTPCDDGNPATVNDVWHSDCTCAGTTPAPCHACLTMSQAWTGTPNSGSPIPWTVNVTNCSTGGTPPFTYLIDFGDGSPLGNSFTHAYASAGTYTVCLTLTDAINCTSTACDTVTVAADGTINPVNTLPCQADFWVMQAFTNDSSNTGGSVTPIPFELWVWNLSSGGTGNFQFLWDFGDGNTSTDPFPTHVYGSGGPYTLCLTIADDAGCTSTHCEEIMVDEDGILGMDPGPEVRSALTIHVIQELPTGIAEQPALEGTNLWPNPATDQLTLMLNSSRSGNIEVSIIGMDGREVRNRSVPVMAGRNLLPMDVSGLPAGLYLLRMANGGNSATMRFVKH